jgi:hypothetical protein
MHSPARLMGWLVLGGLTVYWGSLAVGASTAPCEFDCADLRRAAFFLGLLSLPGVPVGAWLLAFSYRTSGTPARSFPVRVTACLLLAFAAVMLLTVAFATFQLFENLASLATGCCETTAPIEYARSSWRFGALGAGLSIAWFGITGAATLPAARSLLAPDTNSCDRLFHVAAASVSIAAIAGVVYSQLGL